MNTTVKSNTDVQNRGAGGMHTRRQAQDEQGSEALHSTSSVESSTITPPNVGLTSNVLPEVQDLSLGENLQTGVSEENVPNPTADFQWYVIRAAHGKEQKGSELMRKNGIEAFYPIITTVKTVGGKRKIIKESRIPNIFFAHGDYDTIKDIIKYSGDDVAPYLHFYCFHHLDNTVEPITVPFEQMKSLMIICGTSSEDIIVKPKEIAKFKEGTRVLVTEGIFKGVEGIVTRFWGQQRVGFVIDKVVTAATAYVPSAFLKIID